MSTDLPCFSQPGRRTRRSRFSIRVSTNARDSSAERYNRPRCYPFGFAQGKPANRLIGINTDSCCEIRDTRDERRIIATEVTEIFFGHEDAEARMVLSLVFRQLSTFDCSNFSRSAATSASQSEKLTQWCKGCCAIK